MKRIAYLLIVAVGCVAPALGRDSTHADDMERIQSATEVLHDVMQMPDKGIPHDILKSAACIAIIPSEKKGAFFIGGNYGKGLVTCRNANGWSAPLFLAISGASIGFQWGESSTDLILVFRGRQGLTRMLSNKFKVGANAEAAAGPVGRDTSAATDASLHAEVLTYSRSKGAFAGISLDGAVVQPDESGNKAFYGTASRDQILKGGVPVPGDAQPLIQEIAAGTPRPNAAG